MKLSELGKTKNYTVLGNTSTLAPKQPTQSKSLGQKVLDVGTGVSNFFGGKAVADTFGSEIAKIGKPQQQKDIISRDQPGIKETVGSGIQLGANLIPGAAEGAPLAGKLLAGIGTGYAFDVGSNLQDKNKSVGKSLEPGVGTALGAGVPLVGAAVVRPAEKIMGRLLKGLGSGVSGVSTQTMDKLINNPEFALKETNRLKNLGNDKILEGNAKTLINGVGKIQNEASSAYRAGLDKLSEIDIKPDKLKAGIETALQKHKINIGQDGIVDFGAADFLDPKIQQRAESVINKITKQEDISGTGIRKLMDIVDNSKFKSAPDGERQAFNAFIADLKSGIKGGIDASTTKLGEINKKYSADMQLSEAAQDIFGNVDYKNLSEVAKAAKKLEGMFNQKGLDPKIIDDYLERIGVSSKNFKTSEAVRQISNKEPTANSVGTSFGEVMRSATSAVVTPEIVRNLSIYTGMAKEKLVPFLHGLKPAARNTVIQALIQANQGNSEQNQ